MLRPLNVAHLDQVMQLGPLGQIFKTDPNDALKVGGIPASTARRWVLRDSLLAGQIALCCVTVTARAIAPTFH